MIDMMMMMQMSMVSASEYSHCLKTEEQDWNKRCHGGLSVTGCATQRQYSRARSGQSERKTEGPSFTFHPDLWAVSHLVSVEILFILAMLPLQLVRYRLHFGCTVASASLAEIKEGIQTAAEGC